MKTFILMLLIGFSLIVNNVLADMKCEDKALNEVKLILKAANPDYFPENVIIKKIGNIQYEKIQIYVTELIWGNLRSSKRLVLLSCSNEYLGNYYIELLPTKLIDNQVIFDGNPIEGNTIDFSNGIPKTIFINSEVYTFESAKVRQ